MSLLALLLSAGCTSAYSVRVAGRVVTDGPAGREPVPEAIVTVSPRFGSVHKGSVAHGGSVDETGAFHYRSSGDARGPLRGVALHVTAPGFVSADRFVAATPAGTLDEREVEVVLEDARTLAPP